MDEKNVREYILEGSFENATSGKGIVYFVPESGSLHMVLHPRKAYHDARGSNPNWNSWSGGSRSDPHVQILEEVGIVDPNPKKEFKELFDLWADRKKRPDGRYCRTSLRNLIKEYDNEFLFPGSHSQILDKLETPSSAHLTGGFMYLVTNGWVIMGGSSYSYGKVPNLTDVSHEFVDSEGDLRDFNRAMKSYLDLQKRISCENDPAIQKQMKKSTERFEKIAGRPIDLESE